MRNEQATILVVDDDDAVRKSLTRLLTIAGYRVLAADSAAGFLRQSEDAARPRCAVLDVRLPDLSGLDLQRRLIARSAALPIVFITGHGDIPMSVKAMKAGAVDFLPKPFDPRQLLDAVRLGVERDRRDRDKQAGLARVQGLLNRLTHREREVMDLVVAGLLNKQIADRLGTAEQTVKVHRGRVMRKLGITSVAELVRLAAQSGVAGD